MALNIQEGSNSLSSISKSNSNGKCSVPHGVTRKELWAYKEAKSLGVGKLSTLDELIYNSQEYWGAFVLLYEMLEEYGTHLVEAAWNHQVYNHAKITSFVFCIFFLTEQTWYIIYEMCVCVAL
jgi:hypothetical protein